MAVDGPPNLHQTASPKESDGFRPHEIRPRTLASRFPQGSPKTSIQFHRRSPDLVGIGLLPAPPCPADLSPMSVLMGCAPVAALSVRPTSAIGGPNWFVRSAGDM